MGLNSFNYIILYTLCCMVKIYLKNKVPAHLEINLEELKIYLQKEVEMKHIVSPDHGTYVIENDSIFFIEPLLSEEYQIKKYGLYKKDFQELIIDNNDYKRFRTRSQLPVNYTLQKMQQFTYKFTKKSMIELVICGTCEKLPDMCSFLSVDKDKSKEKATNKIKGSFTITDFYFQCSKENFDLENPFFQEEFNEFLSLLN